MSSYWIDRLVSSQQKISDTNIKVIQAQLKKYYRNTAKTVMKDFENTYNKLLLTTAEGLPPTPADLYKLSSYWEMQGQLKRELQKLGDKEIELLSKKFEDQFYDIYKAAALPSQTAFYTISQEAAVQTVNSIWAADGKLWSQRVWTSTDKLAQRLNDKLMETAIAGRSTKELKQELMDVFGVSYSSANRLVETEMAHIQTQAAAERYKSYGLEYYEFLADTDKRTCDECGALDGKRFKFSEMEVGVNCPPIHPCDRCCIIPVVE